MRVNVKQKSTTITVRLEPLLKMSVEQIAAEKKVDVSIVTRWALHDYVQRQNAAQPFNRNQAVLALDV